MLPGSHGRPLLPGTGGSGSRGNNPEAASLGGWMRGGAGCLRARPTGRPRARCLSSARSVPDHPVSQLLKRLQCAVYRALYPVVSRGAAATSAPRCCSLPPDANGLLAPGSRRLRPSQSLHCMLCPPEPSPAPQPAEGPPASPPTPPPHPGPPDSGADSSPKGPPSPSPLAGKDSSFEDLEPFLATSERWGCGPGGRPEPQTPGVKEEPLMEQLKSTVKDIHNAIGEGGSTGRTGGRVGQHVGWAPGGGALSGSGQP